jgi:hypothetical protein
LGVASDALLTCPQEWAIAHFPKEMRRRSLMDTENPNKEWVIASDINFWGEILVRDFEVRFWGKILG